MLSKKATIKGVIDSAFTIIPRGKVANIHHNLVETLILNLRPVR